MEIPLEDESGSLSASFQDKAAHQAFRDRWKETDDTMCRHSMSFHLHHTLRSEFFASYLYLVEKIPLGKEVPQGPEVCPLDLLLTSSLHQIKLLLVHDLAEQR